MKGTREELWDIFGRAIPAQGRETAGASMDLDYAQDLLDEWFAARDRQVEERVRQARLDERFACAEEFAISGDWSQHDEAVSGRGGER